MSHGQIYIKQIMPRKGAGVGGKVHKVLPTKKATQKGCFLLVGLSGLEPPTPTLSGWCSNRLSYNPIYIKKTLLLPVIITKALMVEIVGLEPTTSCVQGRRSSQLSYTPMFIKALL